MAKVVISIWYETLNSNLQKLSIFYREVVLGELRIDTDPDCTNDGRSCAPRKITREIKTDDQIIVHENYQPGSQTQANDIALIRLNEPVPLYDDDPKRYIMGWSSSLGALFMLWTEF